MDVSKSKATNAKRCNAFSWRPASGRFSPVDEGHSVRTVATVPRAALTIAGPHPGTGVMSWLVDTEFKKGVFFPIEMFCWASKINVLKKIQSKIGPVNALENRPRMLRSWLRYWALMPSRSLASMASATTWGTFTPSFPPLERRQKSSTAWVS